MAAVAYTYYSLFPSCLMTSCPMCPSAPALRFCPHRQVEDTCWDVVLIDAPRGYSHKHPGRAEAAVWTAAMSARCQRSRALRSTLVFLHDVDRPVEKLILQKVFTTAAWTRIGTVNTPGHDCGEMACKPLSAFT